jgi:hypothetical protein
MKKLLFSLVFLAQPALTAEQALTKCRQIEEIAERVVCYDNIVDSYFPKDSSEGTQTTKPPESKPAGSAETGAVPDAQSLFGETDAEAKRIVETSMAIEQISQIEATIADVRKSATKKLIVTLDNEQIWRQLDNQTLHLKSGEEVVIRKASLGSFLLEKKSGSRSIRVKRAN